MQTVEAFVDLLQAKPAAEQAIDRQSPITVQRDKTRDIAQGHTGADVAALERALLADQLHHIDRQCRARRRQPGGHGHAAAPGHLHGVVQGAHRACHLEHIIGAAAGQRAYLLHGIGIAAVDHCRGPHIHCQGQLLRRQVHRNHLASTCGAGPQHRRQADAAQADHHRRRPHAQLRGVDHRPPPCQHRTTKQRRFNKRQFAVDLHQ
ncbi:hypothetical protein D3C85_1353290 [compost metagenome]